MKYNASKIVKNARKTEDVQREDKVVSQVAVDIDSILQARLKLIDERDGK